MLSTSANAPRFGYTHEAREVCVMIFWNFEQGRRDVEARRQSHDAIGKAERVDERVSELEESLDQLSLICRGMWNLLQRTSGLAEEDLRAELERLEAIELGTNTSKTCLACQRANSRRRNKCLYCGTALPGENAFDRV